MQKKRFQFVFKNEELVDAFVWKNQRLERIQGSGLQRRVLCETRNSNEFEIFDILTKGEFNRICVSVIKPNDFLKEI